MKRVLTLAAVVSACCWAQPAPDCQPAPSNAGAKAELWKFDRIDQIGGYKTTVLGHPRVIDSPVGKAVEFNGVDDTDARMLSEIRVVDGRWRLDSFAMAGGQSRNS